MVGNVWKRTTVKPRGILSLGRLALPVLVLSQVLFTASVQAQGTINLGSPPLPAGPNPPPLNFTVGAVDVAFSNPVNSPGGPNFLVIPGQGLALQANTAFDVTFNNAVQLTQYSIGAGSGGGFSVTGPGVSSTPNAVNPPGTFAFNGGPLTLQANQAYTITADGTVTSFTFGSFTFILAPTPPPNTQINGDTTQTGFQTNSHLFQLLSRQLQNILCNRPCTCQTLPPPCGEAMSAEQWQAVLSGEDISPLTEGSQIRGQSPGLLSGGLGGWDGWVSGYAIGGQVEGLGSAAGLDYDSAGTQIGLYRLFNENTLVGFFGGFGGQNLNSTNGNTADVEGGQLGAFLYRGDAQNNYYLLAANAGYDNYQTSTSSGALGDYDGAQTGVYLERGWVRPWRNWVFRPLVGLQYLGIYQDDHQQSGTSTALIDDISAHSLRSLVGGAVNLAVRNFAGGTIAPTVRAQWMHEFLETSTVVNGSVGGAAFSTTGLSLGRDWAVLGAGLNYNRGGRASLFANYDLQVNDRQAFHAGSGGLRWNW